MANESFASSLVIEVGGSPLSSDVACMLTTGSVEDSATLPGAFVLRFRDQDHLVVEKGRMAIGARVHLKIQTSDPSPPATLIDGEVTALSTELGSTGTVTEVRGFDRAHRLLRGRRVVGYPNMTVSDVVGQVARRAGLRPGRIDAFPGVGGRADTQISQDNVSDWEFLSRLARRVGAQVGVSGQMLSFRRPEPPRTAPALTERATQNPLVLEVGTSLLSLRATVTAAAQVPEVQVRGWDSERKKALTASATPVSADAKVAGANPAGLGTTFRAPPLLAADSRLGTQAEVTAAADALADGLGGGAVEVDGVAKGNPRLRAGTAVALTGVGAPFQGQYTLTSTRHVFAVDAGYTTAFVISAGRDRSLFGLASGGGNGGGGLGGGLVPAIVSNVKDPLDLGRVCLTFPWLSAEFTSGWARCVQAGAGRDRGTVLLPEVGDEVLVGFADGDVDRPYVLGGLHSSADKPPRLSAPAVDDTSGEVAVRAIVSRTGHRLELAEATGGPDGVLLATGDKKVTIRLDEKTGTVEITGAKGVTVDAGSGPLDLTGGTVTVTASGALELTGARVAISATTDVTVTGVPIKLN